MYLGIGVFGKDVLVYILKEGKVVFWYILKDEKVVFGHILKWGNTQVEASYHVQ